MAESAIFMIEGGRALDLVKAHISEVYRVDAVVRALAQSVGGDRIYTSREDGRLLSVVFRGERHPDFTLGNKYGSKPKKGTESAVRFAAQVGYRSPEEAIQTELGVLWRINYGADGSQGFRMLGVPFSSCGFLWLGDDGPFAMWIPDVQSEVRSAEAGGYVVGGPAKSFCMEIDGCRRIDREEWELLVAQKKLADKQAARAAFQEVSHA
ncbi:hypothetical protein [Cupriavidus sp. TMH.W2]|uniref:hypothetical protein n=1 Tax=Cupriavidus sp. TMH.W2 TaxID=3434465 RepID=UPI003D770486